MRADEPLADAKRLRSQALVGARNTFWGVLLIQLITMAELIRYIRIEDDPAALMRSLLVPALLTCFIVLAYTFYRYRLLSETLPNPDELHTDPATGVFTMPYINSCLENEYRRARQNSVCAAVAYIDLVNLERVNHGFGHAVGDIVLKAVAQLISRHVRAGDVLGRAGGDEFVLVMPETRFDEAQQVLAEIRDAVRRYRLDLGKKGTIDFVDCHWGLALYPTDGLTPQEITAAARENVENPPEPAPQPKDAAAATATG